MKRPGSFTLDVTDVRVTLSVGAALPGRCVPSQRSAGADGHVRVRVASLACASQSCFETKQSVSDDAATHSDPHSSIDDSGVLRADRSFLVRVTHPPLACVHHRPSWPSCRHACHSRGPSRPSSNLRRARPFCSRWRRPTPSRHGACRLSPGLARRAASCPPPSGMRRAPLLSHWPPRQASCHLHLPTCSWPRTQLQPPRASRRGCGRPFPSRRRCGPKRMTSPPPCLRPRARRPRNFRGRLPATVPGPRRGLCIRATWASPCLSRRLSRRASPCRPNGTPATARATSRSPPPFVRAPEPYPGPQACNCKFIPSPLGTGHERTAWTIPERPYPALVPRAVPPLRRYSQEPLISWSPLFQTPLPPGAPVRVVVAEARCSTLHLV